MKTIIALLISALILLCFSGNSFAAGINIKEGMWQLETSMTIPGMPHKMPSTTFTQCITKATLIPPVNKEDGCQIQDQSINGNTLTYTMVCSHDGDTTTGHGSFNYSYDKMSGQLEITTNGMQFITSYQGKWTGPCQQ
ncbi:MAG: hypothetical protein B6I36_06290 [Desulfobacteraceae bacterium 4572_35.1]|nr:MAG: hypothetical protein B6I36_06290 [Desulfobacteraceae bacterium 4572_35.1]